MDFPDFARLLWETWASIQTIPPSCVQACPLAQGPEAGELPAGDRGGRREDAPEAHRLRHVPAVRARNLHDHLRADAVLRVPGGLERGVHGSVLCLF